MVKLFSNGKKVVKFFLRVLPFILFLSVLIFVISTCNQSYEFFGSDNNLIDYFLYSLDYIYSDYGSHFFDMFGINSSLYEFFFNTLHIDISVFFPFDFVVSTLVYELFLSFLFLIFDVFNYMFTIAERFLNKEERLGEK